MGKGRWLLIAYGIMLPVMFILPFYSAEGYSVLRNTTSHLGAQNTPNAWVMNAVFVLLGGATVLEAWRGLGEFWFHKIVLSVFGIGLILTAVFQHAPITDGVPFSITEDQLHSLFASVAGMSFTLFAIATMFIETSPGRRVVALLMAVIATVLSLLIFQMDSYAGVWQRLMFILAFVWLVEFFRSRT